jgi:anti-sigma B factor antagonist
MQAGKTIVDVSGEVDMRTSRTLQEKLRELVGKKVSPIIVNFENVEYMDSSGLATLVECLQGVRTYDGRLLLYGLSSNLQEVFRVLKLDSIFSMVASEQEALG